MANMPSGDRVSLRFSLSLTKADRSALETATEFTRRTQVSIVKEALVEWLRARGYLLEQQEVDIADTADADAPDKMWIHIQAFQRENARSSFGTGELVAYLQTRLPPLGRPRGGYVSTRQQLGGRHDGSADLEGYIRHILRILKQRGLLDNRNDGLWRIVGAPPGETTGQVLPQAPAQAQKSERP